MEVKGAFLVKKAIFQIIFGQNCETTATKIARNQDKIGVFLWKSQHFV